MMSAVEIETKGKVKSMTNASEMMNSLRGLSGKLLVVDPVTDEHETATSCTVVPLAIAEDHYANPMASGGAALGLATVTITDQAVIRALYDHPTASEYGDGSYTVNLDTAFAVGDLVEGGLPGTEDYDTGRILSINGDVAVVGWDSGVRTSVALAELRLNKGY